MEEISKIIAYNLQTHRQAKQLSLGQLSELSGVSKVLLSQIERGNNNPTINTIWKITNALKVPYTALLDAPSDDIQFVSKSDIHKRMHAGTDKGCRISCCFSSTATQNIEFFFMQLEPGAEHVSQGHTQKTKEYIFVQRGQVLLIIDDKDYVLQEGDAIVFSADRPHICRNTGNIQSIVISANLYMY